jgi:hypothetical protein
MEPEWLRASPDPVLAKEDTHWKASPTQDSGPMTAGDGTCSEGSGCRRQGTATLPTSRLAEMP